ncbi:hypothetical protein KPH14_011004 [Odynerus spinipes]|uniref:Uncharacterized protein n=1 Tax=Odynerus spinipes TaxID=1348599 RepID=A0AAD9RWQ7_9HYME|nr:hypothetical protein KPH14_011004 [Odynerus spinipes]
MNHVKCIFNVNVPRRVSSNTGITQHGNCRSESSFKKRISKPRPAAVDNSFMLAVRKVYPLLVQRHREDTRIGDNRREMLYCMRGSKSKSIATSLRRLLSDKKLPLYYVDAINSKQLVRFASSSNLSYDRTLSYDDDRESRSYAQMITAYNETMTTVDNASSILQDSSHLKKNVQLSRTLFRSTSTLSSAAYNCDSFTIKENKEETSTTDLCYAIDTITDNDDLYDAIEKVKDLDVYSPVTTSKPCTRSYANIIADYSATMDVNSILNKYRNDFPKLSTVSFSTSKATAVEEPPVERNVSEFVSSPDLSTCKKMNTKEELEWLMKVDKILNDMKNTTGKASTKVNKSVPGLQENDVLECVTEQAVWVDKSTLSNRRKINVAAAPEIEKNEEETQYRQVRVEMADTSGQNLQASSNKPTSSSLDASSRKDWTQMPRSTETIPMDPQVELRMAPSGNESIVSVNVADIAKAMESRNHDSKELSVIVSSKHREAAKVKPENVSNVFPDNANFGSMRISISEGSLPVKELELSINGKPISDVRSIKARTETLNVMTSRDKVEIRVPYFQDNPSNVSSNTKSFAKNVQNTESVLKLRIATAFDGTSPSMTTDTTKSVHTQSNLSSRNPEVKYTHTRGSNAITKMAEVPPPIKTVEKSATTSSIQTVEKSATTSSMQTFEAAKAQVKSEEARWAKIKNKFLGGSLSPSVSDVKRSEENIPAMKKENIPAMKKENIPAMKKENIPPVKKEDIQPVKTVTSNTVKKAEPPKDKSVKSASEKENIKSLADIISKQTGKSSGGNPSGFGKPKGGSNQPPDGSKPPASGNKRESRTTDETKTKPTMNNRSSKTDTFDQRLSPKWSPWWTSSDAYVKLKKEEDYYRSYSTPPNMTEEQERNDFSPMDKVTPKTTQESIRASPEEKPLPAKSQDPPKPKVKESKVEEKKYETKESTNASSKVRDTEKTSTSSSMFQSENVPITRHDSPRVNEKTNRQSLSSPPKITEEKLSKRNEDSLKKETRNATTTKEVESTKNVVAKDNVSVSIKEVPKVDATLSSVESKRTENTLSKNTSSPNVLSEGKLNLQADIKIKDSMSRVTKQVRSANTLDIADSKMKEILNSMKPIEKKKDGTLIDYGVKVPSRKKPEKFKPRPKFTARTSDAITRKEITKNSDSTVLTISESKKEDLRLGTQNDIHANQSAQSINVSKLNPIKYSPRNTDIREDEAKKETVLAKDKPLDKGKDPVTSQESKKEIVQKPVNPENVGVDVDVESLFEKTFNILEITKDRISSTNVAKDQVSPKSSFTNEVPASKEESVNTKNVNTPPKPSEVRKEISSKPVQTEKVITSDESLNEQIPKIWQRSKDRSIPYQNVVKESPTTNSTNKEPVSVKEDSLNIKSVKTEYKFDEDVREPFEGTVVPKPSKSTRKSTKNIIEPSEPLAGTIVRRSSKDMEKRKSKNVSYKRMSKSNTSPPRNLLEPKTNKNRGDSSGSQSNTGIPSGPVSSNGPSSPNMIKSSAHSTKSIDLDKLEEIGVKSADRSVNPKKSDKELVYSVWLQRSKQKTDDKKP